MEIWIVILVLYPKKIRPKWVCFLCSQKWQVWTCDLQCFHHNHFLLKPPVGGKSHTVAFHTLDHIIRKVRLTTMWTFIPPIIMQLATQHWSDEIQWLIIHKMPAGFSIKSCICPGNAVKKNSLVWVCLSVIVESFKSAGWNYLNLLSHLTVLTAVLKVQSVSWKKKHKISVGNVWNMFMTKPSWQIQIFCQQRRRNILHHDKTKSSR